MIWLPMVCTGLNAAMGSWGMRAISAAAELAHLLAHGVELRQIDGGSSSSSEPEFACESRISPSTMRPGGWIRRSTDLMVTLLPQPLSPTMPTTWPG